MSITVKVIDGTLGRPAEGVVVRIDTRVGDGWVNKAEGCTAQNGYLEPPEASRYLDPGIHRLEVNADTYFATLGVLAFQPRFAVMFRVLNPSEDINLVVMITPFSHMICRAH